MAEHTSYANSPLSSSPCGGEAGNNGNIAYIADFLNFNWTQSFTYDGLNRLTSAFRSDGGYNHTYNYDSFGNLLIQDNLNSNPSYTINSATNQLVRWNATTNLYDLYRYDAAGNLTSSDTSMGTGTSSIGGHSYTYNAQSQITSVDGGATASYLYNGMDERSYKQTSTDTTDYIYLNGQPMSERSATYGPWQDYIYANGQKIVRVASPAFGGTSVPSYYLDDHLGTTQVELDAFGNVTWQGQFTPFGAELPDGSTAMHYKFTGKERDSESGLDYFGARYYASGMGRFMSPDWAAKAIPLPYAKLDNPQTLNLYAYVGNNPLSRRDPDGHYQCSGSKDQCAAIKSALDVVRKADSNLKECSKERTRLDKVLSFYGAEGQKNGVNVNFGKIDGAVGQTSTSSFFGFFKTTPITFDSSLVSKFGDAGKGETVAHEGTHGIDQREGETGTNPYAKAFYGEVHAYQSESYVDKGLGVRTESDGDNPVWAPGMSWAQSAEAIRQNAKANADQECKDGGCNP